MSDCSDLEQRVQKLEARTDEVGRKIQFLYGIASRRVRTFSQSRVLTPERECELLLGALDYLELLPANNYSTGNFQMWVDNYIREQLKDFETEEYERSSVMLK